MIGYCLKCLLWDSPPPFKHFSKRHGFGFCGYYSKNLKIRFLDSNNSNFITHIINGTKWDTPSNAMYSDLNAICLNCPVPSPHPPKNQNEKVREGFGVYIFYSQRFFSPPSLSLELNYFYTKFKKCPIMSNFETLKFCFYSLLTPKQTTPSVFDTLILVSQIRH